MANPSPDDVDRVRARLDGFIGLNPSASIDALESPQECIAVITPWGDDTLAIELPEDADALYDALNALRLPDRYSAIWHSDSLAFEVIYTAYPVPESISDVIDRSFTFTYDGRHYDCHYGPSSARLMAISEHVFPLAVSGTYYRNMFSFNHYSLAQKGKLADDMERFGQPLSFWLSPMEWDEDRVLKLVSHVNFYMTYFDSRSPRVLVHSPQSDAVATKPPIRYKEVGFPDRVIANAIDDNLLHFWDASLAGDPIRKFLYNYQILEYAAFYYLEEDCRRQIRKVLSSPGLLGNLDRGVYSVIEAVHRSKVHDVQKVQHLIKSTVEPDTIWNEFAQNMEVFSQPLRFDGGFERPALIKPDWTLEDFRRMWIPAFPEALRQIRNALSHGREQQQVSVITPTIRNFQLLQAWIGPISATAREVMAFRHLA